MIDAKYRRAPPVALHLARLHTDTKTAGITLYTVQVNTGGDPTSTLLQNCASTSDKFYLLTAASQINTTFNTIGTNQTKLRVAQ